MYRSSTSGGPKPSPSTRLQPDRNWAPQVMGKCEAPLAWVEGTHVRAVFGHANGVSPESTSALCSSSLRSRGEFRMWTQVLPRTSAFCLQSSIHASGRCACRLHQWSYVGAPATHTLPHAGFGCQGEKVGDRCSVSNYFILAIFYMLCRMSFTTDFLAEICKFKWSSISGN